MKKNRFFLVLSLFTIIGLSFSCKKGANDPAISLLTRKSRLSNFWEIESYRYQWRNTINGNYTSGIDLFDGEMIIGTFENLEDDTLLIIGESTDIISVYQNSFRINKDGTFSKKWATKKIVTNDFGVGISVATTMFEETREGSWAFVGKEVGFYKNKERILLNTTYLESYHQLTDNITFDSGESVINPKDTVRIITDFYPGENSEIWAIDGLKKEQLTLISESNSTSLFNTVKPDSTIVKSKESFRSEMTIELR